MCVKKKIHKTHFENSAQVCKQYIMNADLLNLFRNKSNFDIKPGMKILL